MKCTMCSEPVNKVMGPDNPCIQPMGGLHISIHVGYAMMTDPIDEASQEALCEICLCHDCSIRFIDMFPYGFVSHFFSGGHPVEICRTESRTHPDGCHYSWF